MHVILQRIILTGYPFKINKRRSTIRFMFFNPADVKYFKPVELRTRMGLRVSLPSLRARLRSRWGRMD